MRKYFLSLMLLGLVACSPIEYFIQPNFVIGETYTATVGSQMISVENGSSGGFGKSGFQQELIYSGLANNVLQIAYREYNLSQNSSYIKGDFSQNLQYDISLSKVISFRDMQIEILEANSNTIKFKVLSWTGDKKYKEWIEEQEKIRKYKAEGRWN